MYHHICVKYMSPCTTSVVCRVMSLTSRLSRLPDAPVLGVVPWAESLDQPSILDLEQMFGTTALSGREHLLRRLVWMVVWNSTAYIFQQLRLPEVR